MARYGLILGGNTAGSARNAPGGALDAGGARPLMVLMGRMVTPSQSNTVHSVPGNAGTAKLCSNPVAPYTSTRAPELDSPTSDVLLPAE